MQMTYRSRNARARHWMVALAVFSLIFALFTTASAAVTITATMTAAVVVDNNSNGKADPGDTLEYTAIISDTGSTAATNVSFNTTIDPNTTLVAGSVISSPIAVNDSFSAIGNVLMVIPAVSGVLTNDLVNGGTLSTSGTSVNGGTVTLNPDGSFNYDPPRGFSGADTFTYTLSNGAGSDQATVTVTVNSVIWFVNNNAGACSATCDGRLSHPYTTLGAFNTDNTGAGSNPAANDNIFIYESVTSYTGPVTLLSGQRLSGQDSNSSLLTITGLGAPNGSNQLPAMNTGAPATTITSAANDVNLNSGNTLNGFTAGNAIIAINGSGFGTLTVADVIVNTNGQALSLTNGTLAATFPSITSSGGTNNILLATGGATLAGNLTISAGALSGASSDAFLLSGTGTSAANMTYNGTINNTTARPVNVQNKTGGTVAFGGAVTGTSNGVNLGSNTGATINFTGGLNLSTGTNGAFSATGGGTVNATQNNTSIVSTLASTTGTALNVQNTTIGASGLTFRSISSNGASRGILLDTTGSSGGLTVTGNGGTCTAANTSGCSGGTIQNGTGGDDSSATPGGSGIVLNSTSNVSLTRMFIHDHSNYGIRGTSVTGFTLDTSVLNGTNGTDAAASASSPFNEGTIKFDNLIGTATIGNTNISGGISNNVRVDNTSATLNRITFTNDIIGCNSTNNGEDGILLESESSGTIKATIQNTSFTCARGDLFNFVDNATSGSTDDLIFNNNTLTNSHPGISTGGGGTTISSNGSKDFTFHIEGNSFRDAVGPGILLVKSTGTASYSGTFTNNSIGVAAVANSGSAEGGAIKIQSAGGGTVTVAITNNQIHQYNNNGIELLTGGGATAQSGNFNATITGNTIDTPGNTAGTLSIPKNGIHLNGGTVVGDTYSICAQIGGAGALANSIATSGKDAVPPTVGDIDFRLRQRQATTVRLPGYGGANNDNTAVQNFVAANNGGNGVPVGLASNTVPTGGGFVGGAACTQPTTMLILPSNRAIVMQQDDMLSPEMASLNSTDKFASVQAPANNTDATGPSLKFTSDVPRQPQANLLPVSKPSLSGETVTQNLANLPAGKRIIIKFRVTVNSPWPNNTPAQVSTQGTIACNPSCGTILTDDPTTGAPNDPTVTPINLTRTYAQPAPGTCDGDSPCYSTLGAAITNVGTGGEVDTYIGTYNETVTLNKTAGLTVTQPITVNGNMNLSQGWLGLSADLNLPSSFTLTLGSLVTTTGTGDVWGRTYRNHAFALNTPYSFGNPNVSLNFASGTPPASIAVFLMRPVPASSGFTNAVQRFYSISPTGVGAFAATLRLHYQLSELNLNVPGPTLALWRYASGNWTQFANTASSLTENWSERSGLTGLSPWVLSNNGPAAPTAVTVSEFNARALAAEAANGMLPFALLGALGVLAIVVWGWRRRS